MKYQDIFIKDFGIFMNAQLRNLNPNFNIIAGGNRAGKTTLLKLLRYIGYGIPKNDKIPPPRNNYDIEAILTDNNHKYSLLINGYSKPKINVLNEKKQQTNNIFSEIDQFTYNQLFTITLEELKKIPTGVNDKEKLQSVLMGAGLKEYILLPQLKERYKQKAEDIGGKRGSVDVYRFKEYNQIIKEGIKLKKEAQNQVQEYYQLKDNLKEIKSDIKDIVNELYVEKMKRNRLDLLKSNFEKLSKMIDIEKELEKEKYSDLLKTDINLYPERADDLYKKYENNINKFEKLISEYNNLVSNSYSKESEKIFLNNSNLIEDYFNMISGLKERNKNLKDKKEELEEKYKNIKKEANQISENLTENLNELLDLNSDIEFKNKLRIRVNDYNELKMKISDKKEKINNLQRALETKKNQIENLKKDNNVNKTNHFYLISFLIGILITTYLSFIDYRFLGLYLINIFLIIKYYKNNKIKEEIKKKCNTLEDEINQIKNEFKILNEEYDKLNSEKEKVVEELNNLKKILNLNIDLEPNLLKDYYEDLLSLKIKYKEYINLKDEVNDKEKKFKEELKKINKFLNIFDKYVSFNKTDDNNILENIEDILSKINLVKKIKEHIQEISSVRLTKESLVEEIKKLEGMELIEKNNREIYVIVQDYKDTGELVKDYESKKEKVKEIKNQLSNITEQMKNAFELEENVGNDQIISIFLKEYERFVSFDHVTEEYNNTINNLEDLSKKLDNLKTKKEKIKLKMNELATEDKLITAESKINKARNNLRPLAEDYAVNKIASNILDKYWQKFLNEKKDKLLNKASELMDKITSGTYNKIEPLEKLNDLNFKLHEKEGRILENIDHLSRGTKEQLFMAIRINRIMEINPPLPVIIDDSLVNFDPKHLRNIFDIINNLKNRNQIFFLTCHPEQIEYLNEKIDNKNFYLLKQGRFEQVEKNTLISNLK